MVHNASTIPMGCVNCPLEWTVSLPMHLSNQELFQMVSLAGSIHPLVETSVSYLFYTWSPWLVGVLFLNFNPWVGMTLWPAFMVGLEIVNVGYSFPSFHPLMVCIPAWGTWFITGYQMSFKSTFRQNLDNSNHWVVFEEQWGGWQDRWNWLKKNRNETTRGKQ
jgi:hypothetical protein